MNAPQASPDSEGLDRDGLADELRPHGVAESAEAFEATSEVAADSEGARTIEGAAVEMESATIVIKNNVFEGASLERISIELNPAVFKDGSIVIHNCRSLADDSMENGPAESTL